jgi:hypothetical protein
VSVDAYRNRFNEKVANHTSGCSRLVVVVAFVLLLLRRGARTILPNWGNLSMSHCLERALMYFSLASTKHLSRTTPPPALLVVIVAEGVVVLVVWFVLLSSTTIDNGDSERRRVAFASDMGFSPVVKSASPTIPPSELRPTVLLDAGPAPWYPELLFFFRGAAASGVLFTAAAAAAAAAAADSFVFSQVLQGSSSSSWVIQILAGEQ